MKSTTRSRNIILIVLLLILLTMSGCQNKTESDTETIGNIVETTESIATTMTEIVEISQPIAFQDENTGLYGYKDKSNNTIIEPKYLLAEDFIGNRAIVTVENPNVDQYIGALSYGIYGLIDTQGNYVVEPKNLITRVDESHFLVTFPLEFWSIDYPGLKQNFIDSDGKLVSDQGYFDVKPVNDNLFMVNDGKKTYFIDGEGSIQEQFPIFYYAAKLNLINNNIGISPVDDLESRIETILNLKGEVIEVRKTTNTLTPEVNYSTSILSDFFGSSIFYPVFTSTNKPFQNNINIAIFDQIKEFDLFERTSSDQIDTTFISDYELAKVNNIITLDLTGYWYGLGAAHPNSFWQTNYFDLNTGIEYKLDDLFDESKDWKSKIAKVVDEQFMQQDEMYLYFDQTTSAEERISNFYTENYGALPTEDGLLIYYGQYEIAPYAAGFPSFLIPYDQLDGYYDVNGEFYKQLLFI